MFGFLNRSTVSSEPNAKEEADEPISDRRMTMVRDGPRQVKRVIVSYFCGRKVSYNERCGKWLMMWSKESYYNCIKVIKVHVSRKVLRSLLVLSMLWFNAGCCCFLFWREFIIVHYSIDQIQVSTWRYEQ
jgi:hypothetical protein